MIVIKENVEQCGNISGLTVCLSPKESQKKFTGCVIMGKSLTLHFFC